MSYDLVGDLYDDDDVGSIGADMLVGDDDLESLLVSGLGNTDIVGAANRKALRRVAQRNAAAVVKTGLDKRRRYPLGFVVTSITAGSTSSIPAAPQNVYRPERLVIPSDIAFDVGVTDIKVGTQSQFVQNVEVPAAIFSEVAIDTGVHFDTAEVGNQVTVSARNKSAATLSFTAALIGTAAK